MTARPPSSFQSQSPEQEQHSPLFIFAVLLWDFTALCPLFIVVNISIAVPSSIIRSSYNIFLPAADLRLLTGCWLAGKPSIWVGFATAADDCSGCHLFCCVPRRGTRQDVRGERRRNHSPAISCTAKKRAADSRFNVEPLN
jgi:hypothetical protein